MVRSLSLGAAAPLKLLAVLLAAAAIFGCSATRSAGDRRGGNSNSNATAPEDTGPVVTVTTTKVESRQVPGYIQATGSLVASETSDVAPKAAGKEADVYVNVGQFVGQGATIIKIDDKDARLRLAEAQAGVKQAQAGVRQAEARLGLEPGGSFNASQIPEVRTAGANYEQAQAQLRPAEANEARYRDLVKSGDVAMITYEQFRTARDTAKAAANAARQQLEAAVNAARQNNQAIKAAQANVEAAQAQVGTAQQAVADTIVRAPFSGFVSARPVAVGEYVTSSTNVATILRSNPIKIQIQIPEADVPQVNIGAGVSIQVDAYKDRNFAGTVVAVNPAVDPASRAATVEAAVENGDNALRSGMFATARINKAGAGTGIYVPRSAVYHDEATNSYRVFAIQDGVARLKVVQLGVDEGDFLQILNGLNGDETVATSNLNELYEGARVAS